MTRLLTVQLHAENIGKFDPLPSIHLCNESAKRARHPAFMDKQDRSFVLLEAVVEELDAKEAPTEAVEQQDCIRFQM